jgi:hypothetical protein
MQTDGYNGDGLRAWKQPYGGSRTYFLYDSEFPGVELSSAGSTTAVTTSGANGASHVATGSARRIILPEARKNTVPVILIDRLP